MNISVAEEQISKAAGPTQQESSLTVSQGKKPLLGSQRIPDGGLRKELEVVLLRVVKASYFWELSPSTEQIVPQEGREGGSREAAGLEPAGH